MDEDERTVEPPGDAPEAAQSGAEDTDTPTSTGDVDARTRAEHVDSGHDPDGAAESFLELEADLDGTTRSSGTRAGSEPLRGLVTGAERVDAAAVPDGYPLDPATEQVIALTIDVRGDESTAYLEWPGETDGASPLRWLLDALDVRLSDLYGRRLLVERSGRHYSVVTPRERPRSNGDWVLGVAAGHALNVALLGVLIATGGLPAAAYIVWAALTFAVLPYATYEDAWYVRTHSDWDHGPLFWATLSALPVLNVPIGLVYSWTRRRAAFLGDEPSLLRRALRRARAGIQDDR